MTDEGRRERRRETARKWRAKNPNYGREYTKLWRAENPGYNAASSTKLRATNPELAKRRVRIANRKRAGGLSPPGETREGVCPVCLKHRKLYWDHDHITGEFRGWLCNTCNMSLGQIGDSLEAAQRLVRYLTK